MTVTIKTPAEIEKMRAAGRLAGQVLEHVTPYVQAGITTDELDKICDDFTVKNGATSAPFNYHGFPKHICTSINQVVCHGIPSDKKLKNGDIVNLDITVIKDGYHGDTSKMFTVGNVPPMLTRLIETTHRCLFLGIEQVRPGAHLGDIGAIIQEHAESNHFSVVHEYCGHGIGKIFHEEPQVLHYGKAGTGLKLEEGMCFTIEPMINQGKRQVRLLGDGWTVITKDRKASAQFEHTLVVTKDGCEIFTLRDEEIAANPELAKYRA